MTTLPGISVPDIAFCFFLQKNGGQLFLNLSNGRKYPVNVGRLNDGRYHIINLDRDKDFIRIRVDGREVNTGRYVGKGWTTSNWLWEQ